MTTLHTETEAFYQEALKTILEAAMHSRRKSGREQPLEQLKLETEWSADEVAYGLEIRLTDVQLADVEADVKSGCTIEDLGSNGTEDAIQDAWDDATQLNNVVVMEHDSLSIVQGILEKVAAGKGLSSGECEWARSIADYLNSRNEVEGRWIETPRQKHDRFLDVKHQREKHNLEEARGKAELAPTNEKHMSRACRNAAAITGLPLNPPGHAAPPSQFLSEIEQSKPARFSKNIARRLAQVLRIFVIGALAGDVTEKVIAVALEHSRNADEALPFLKTTPRYLAIAHANHDLISDG
jgi:hypothetical protein